MSLRGRGRLISNKDRNNSNNYRRNIPGRYKKLPKS